jgi:hypothetical protein
VVFGLVSHIRQRSRAWQLPAKAGPGPVRDRRLKIKVVNGRGDRIHRGGRGGRVAESRRFAALRDKPSRNRERS